MDGPKKSWSSRPKTHLFLWQFLFSKAKSEVFHKVAQAYKIFLHTERYFIKVHLSVRNPHACHEFIIAYPSCPNDDDVLSLFSREFDSIRSLFKKKPQKRDGA